MRQVFANCFGSSVFIPDAGDPARPIAKKLMVRLRVGMGLVVAAMCAAFISAGCAPQTVACGLACIGAMAFGPRVKALAAPRLRYSVSASVAMVLCVSLLLGATVGCTPAEQKQVKVVVGQIGAEIPKVLPLINAAAFTAEALLPAEAIIITGVDATVQAGLAELAALCNAYAAAPSDSIWQSIIAAVDKMVDAGAQGILDAAKITNPVSRAAAAGALGAIQTLLLVIDGFVQQAQTSAQVKATAQARAVKLSQIRAYLDADVVARETGHSFGQVYAYETSLGF